MDAVYLMDGLDEDSGRVRQSRPRRRRGTVWYQVSIYRLLDGVLIVVDSRDGVGTATVGSLWGTLGAYLLSGIHLSGQLRTSMTAPVCTVGTVLGVGAQSSDVMASPPNDSGSGREYANLTVSAEFRDKVRVAKAQQGLSYEEYLSQHLPIEAES